MKNNRIEVRMSEKDISVLDKLKDRYGMSTSQLIRFLLYSDYDRYANGLFGFHDSEKN